MEPVLLNDDSDSEASNDLPTESELEKRYYQVINMCSEYLCTRIKVENCIEMLLFAEDYGLYIITEYCIQFTADHSQQVFTSDQFLEATPLQLTRLLHLFRYQPIANDEIQNGVILWAEYERKQRYKYLDGMLRLVLQWIWLHLSAFHWILLGFLG